MPHATNPADGVRINYEVEGQGPPLLLMHGLGGSLQAWRARGYVDALKGDYRLVLVDARGHSESDKPHDPKAYALELMVGDAVAVLDALQIGEAHYFGYSMGGRIGFRIPAYAPSRFHSLVLGGYDPYLGEKQVEALQEILEGLQLLLRDPEAAVARREASAGRPLSPQERAGYLANDAEALIAAVQSAFEQGGLNSNELAGITRPCLVFAGDADPRHDGAREAASHMPNATFVSLPGLNHGTGLERIDLVLPHLTKFLAGLSRPVGPV